MVLLDTAIVRQFASVAHVLVSDVSQHFQTCAGVSSTLDVVSRSKNIVVESASAVRDAHARAANCAAQGGGSVAIFQEALDQLRADFGCARAAISDELFAQERAVRARQDQETRLRQ